MGRFQPQFIARLCLGLFLSSFAVSSPAFSSEGRGAEVGDTGAVDKNTPIDAHKLAKTLTPRVQTARQDTKVEQPLAVKAGVKHCQETVNQHLQSAPVEFLPGRFQLSKQGAQSVAQLAEILNSCGRAKAIIAGHTDTSGQALRNQRLSGQRAASVMGQLVRSGVDPARLRAVGFGAEMPLVDNETPENRALNRRIELKLYE